MAQGLPSSLGMAQKEAQDLDFEISNETQKQLEQQQRITAQRKKQNETLPEMSPVPHVKSGNYNGKVPYMSEFTAAAQRYGVPVNVLMGLAEQESRFNPTALGTQTQWGRAKGLMQYLDTTAASMGINPYDPAQSIDAAAKQLRQRLDKGYSMIDAVREHFAGPDRKKWGDKTYNYGIEVMQRAGNFGNVAPEQKPQQQATPAQKPAQTLDSGRFKALNAEDIKKIEAAKKRGDSEVVLQIGMKPIKIEGAKKKDPLVTDQNKDAGFWSDTGNLLLSGVINLAQSSYELASRVPMTQPLVNAMNKIDQYFVGKTSQQIFDEADKHYSAKLSAPTAKAREKLWVVEPGDKLEDGTLAKEWGVGPAWKDPRAYYAGIVQSFPEMAVTMGGSLALAKGAFTAAIKTGASREVASKAAARTATLAGSFLEGGLGGASSAVQVRKQVNALPDSTIQQSEAVREMMSNGMTLQEAKKSIAEDASTKAFLLAGIGTGVFGGLGDRAIAKIITEGTSSRIKSVLSGAVAEGVFEEMPQSTAQQMAQNYAMQGADPNQKLMQGVANQAAGGLALGATMGGGIGGATHRSNQHVPEQQSEQVPAPKEGPIERAIGGKASLDQAIDAEIAAVQSRDNMEQLIDQQAGAVTDEVQATEDNTADHWLGSPGETVNISPKEDPEAVYTVQIEGYQNGEVFARDQDGTPIQFGRGDIISAIPVNNPENPDSSKQPEMVTEQTKVEQPAEIAQIDAPKQEEIKTPKAEIKATENTAVKPAESPAKQPEKTDRALEDMTEAELRARMKYIAQQAKTNNGWDKRLMAERRKVEAEIGRKGREKTPSVSEMIDGSVKWDGMNPAERMASAEKAGIASDQANGIKGKAWGMLDTASTDKLALSWRKAKPAETKAPKAKQPKAEKVDYSDAVPEAPKTTPVSTSSDFERLIIDSHLNNPRQKPALIDQEAKSSGRPRHEVLKQVQGIIADINAGKIQQPAPVQDAPNIEGKDIGEGWSEFSSESGTKGIPRADMPQIKAEHRGAMVNFMNARGINHKEETVTADSLKPTQKEFSKEKVQKAIDRDGGDRSILVSKDDHVLDGHHQWMAAREKGEDVKIIRLDAKISDLLDAAHDFPSSTVDEASEKTAVKTDKTKAKAKTAKQVKNVLDLQINDKVIIPASKNVYGEEIPAQELTVTGLNGNDISLTDGQGMRAVESAKLLKQRYGDRLQIEKAKAQDTPKQEAQSIPNPYNENELRAQIRHLNAENNSAASFNAKVKDQLPNLYQRAENLSKSADITSAGRRGNTHFKHLSFNADDSYISGDPWPARPTADEILQQAIWHLSQQDSNNAEIEIPKERAVKAQKSKPAVSANTIVSEDAAEKARELLRKKISQVNTGIDPEMFQAGLMLAIYHIEKGTRTFAAYAQAMISDLGDGIKPYLKSFYMGIKYDPRASGFEGLSTAAEVDEFDLAQLDEKAPESAPQEDDAPASKGWKKENNSTWINDAGHIIAHEPFDYNGKIMNVFNVYRSREDQNNGEYVITKESLERAQAYADQMGKKRYSRTERLAPNGKPSNLTEQQWHQVRTPEFKKWFGDWENDPKNASKVIDKNGEPMVVYHGSKNSFTVFDASRLSENTGNDGHYGAGVYFSMEKAEAETYGKNIISAFLNIKAPVRNSIESLEPFAEQFGYEKKFKTIDKNWLAGEIKKKDPNAGILASLYADGYTFDNIWPEFEKRGGKYQSEINLDEIGDIFENIDNSIGYYSREFIEETIGEIPEDKKIYGYENEPDILDITDRGNAGRSFSNTIQKAGHDGVIAGSEFVVFKPEQIKSATDNTGAFDASNPDIRFSRTAMTKPENAKTGMPVTVNFARNPVSSKNYPAGMDFGQDIEPAGEYLSLSDATFNRDAQPSWEYGIIDFKNPLVLEHKSTDSTGWKKDLSEMFEGKTGKALTVAIKKAGYDAVITKDKYGYSEAVNLSGKKAAFSKSDQQPKNLFVAHNLSAENIMAAHDLGGLAAPSIAVARSDVSDFSGFGEVTLLADPKLLEDSKIRTFDADVYSPRQPRAHYDLDKKKFNALMNDLEQNSFELRLPDLDNASSSDGAENFIHSEAMQFAYLRELNKAPKLKPKKTDPLIKSAAKIEGSRFQLPQNPKFAAIAKKYIVSKIESYNKPIDPALPEDAQEVMRAINAKGIARAKARYYNDDGTLKPYAIDDFAMKVDSYRKSGGYDYAQLRVDVAEKMRNEKTRKGFEQWATDKFNDMVISKTLFKGLTNAGNKSYTAYTLENVVKEMTQQLQAGEGTFYGAGSVRSAYANEMHTLKEIQARRDQIIHESDFEKIKEESNNVLRDALEKLKPFYKYDSESWGYANDAGAAIAEGQNGVRSAFKQTAESKKIIADLTEYMMNLPTAYFEAKAQRAVQFSEFNTAVVPKGMNKDALQVLRDAGLKIKAYDPKDKSSRAQVIAQQEKLLFSRNENLGTGTTDADVRAVLEKRFGKPVIAKLEKNGILSIAESYDLPGVEGFALDGKVTLVADALTAESIVPTFLHELGGHAGFQGVLKPTAYKNLMQQFDNLVKAKDPLALEAKRLAERETDPDVRNDEYLPYLVTVASRAQAQRPGIKSLISRILAAVKAWAFEKTGVNLGLNANDIVALAERMVNAVSKQDSAVNGQRFSQADQTNTPEFKAWFGNSKVVDENGKPQVRYHGTRDNWTQWDKERAGGLIHTTDDIVIAEHYAQGAGGGRKRSNPVYQDHDGNIFELDGNEYVNRQDGTRLSFQDIQEMVDYGDINTVYPDARVQNIYVRAENPLDLNTKAGLKVLAEIDPDTRLGQGIVDLAKDGQFNWSSTKNEFNYKHWANDLVPKLKALGYDAIAFSDDGHQTLSVFDSEQIKSATDNTGAFDASNPDIRFSRADDDLAPVSREEYASNLSKWWEDFKERPSDTLTNAMQQGSLGLVPLRPMLSELAKDLPSAKVYLRVKDKMDAMRNEWHAKVDAVAQQWLKYRIKNREENRKLMNIMHESTLAQVDPSKPFESLLTTRERIALENNQSSSNPAMNIIIKKAEQDEIRRKAHAELQAIFDELSPEAKGVFKEVRDAYGDMADAFDEVLLNNLEKAINVRIKKAEREYKREIERIQDEGMEGKERDDAVATAEKALKNAKTKIAWNRKARMTQLRQQFETQRLAGPYFPLARFGDFFVTVRDVKSGEVVSFSRFEKAQDQRRFAVEMRKDKNYKVEEGALANAAETRKAVDPNFVADVEDILADLPNAEQVKDEVWQRYLQSLPDMSVRKSRIHRKGRAGFNEDAVRAFGHQLFHGSHQLARMAHSMDLEDALDQARDDARETKDPTRSSLIVNEMEKRHQFVMNPTGGQLATWASSFAFVWYLAGSPKAALMNLFQTPIMGVPILGAYAGGGNGMARAAKQMSVALVDFTKGRGYAEKAEGLTADERDAMAKGYETGIIDKTQGHELAGVAESGVEYNAIRERVMKAIAWGFHHTERLNREVTFLAAYRLARQKGVAHDQAIIDAGDLTWKTHFDYSNTSRPRLMHNDIMKILLVFRNFQLNMLFRLFRDVHQVFSADSKEAKKEALTQLAGISGMMMINAGITGTWLYGLAMVLAGMFTGDDDPEEELKKAMVNSLGPNLAGLALYGVPGHTTGTALSESVGMPDLWFRSPDSEMEGEDAMNFWISQMLGAVHAIGAQFVRGYGQIKKGEEYRGIETMMPKMLKDPMKAYRYGTEGAKNMKGDTVAEVEWSDVVKQALGFTPARISEQYKINNLNYNKQTRIQKGRKELLDQYYKADKENDEKEIAEIDKRIETFNEQNPDSVIMPKHIIASIKAREKGAESAVGGIRYVKKTSERILEEQVPSIYK